MLPGLVTSLPPAPEAAFTQSGWIGAPDRGRGRQELADLACDTPGGAVYQNNTGMVISVTIAAPPNEGFAQIFVKSRYSDPSWLRAAYAFASGTATAYVPAGGYYCPAGGGSPANFYVTIFRNNVPPSSYLTPVIVVTSDAPIGQCLYREEVRDSDNSFVGYRDVYYEVWRRDYAVRDGVARPPMYFVPNPNLGILADTIQGACGQR